eukprot:5498494-Amphidinium_carterae.1
MKQCHSDISSVAHGRWEASLLEDTLAQAMGHVPTAHHHHHHHKAGLVARPENIIMTKREAKRVGAEWRPSNPHALICRIECWVN